MEVYAEIFVNQYNIFKTIKYKRYLILRGHLWLIKSYIFLVISHGKPNTPVFDLSKSCLPFARYNSFSESHLTWIFGERVVILSAGMSINLGNDVL